MVYRKKFFFIFSKKKNLNVTEHILKIIKILKNKIVLKKFKNENQVKVI